MRKTKEPAHTLEEVREILGQVVEKLGKPKAVEIATISHDGVDAFDKFMAGTVTATAKHLDRAYTEAKAALDALPSEKDAELIKQIDAAVAAESDATVALQDRGVELGKYLLEAFSRYPTQEGYRKFLRFTAFKLTLKEAIPYLNSVGADGRKAGDELKRQLGVNKDKQQRHRDKAKANKQPGLRNPEPAKPPPPVTGNRTDDIEANAEAAKARISALPSEPEPKSHATSGDTKQIKKGTPEWARQEILFAARHNAPGLSLAILRTIGCEIADILKPHLDRKEAQASAALKELEPA